jgi:hypothetical protein
MSPSSERHLRWAVIATAALTVNRIRAEAQDLPAALTRQEPPGSDVFVAVREATVREKPGKAGRSIGKVPGGSRLRLIEAGEQSLKVEIGEGAGPTDIRRPPIGFLSREAVCVFPPDDRGTADLLAAGRVLSGSQPHRRLAAAFLLRACERLRAVSADDPAIELLLGETVEALAKAGGPFPPGLEVARAPGEPILWVYSGDAFQRVLALTSGSDGETSARLRARATAGALRQQYPRASLSLMALWNETAAWLALVETARDSVVARSSAERLGAASLALGRLLVASRRLPELSAVEGRVREAAVRVRALLRKETAGRKLLARAAILSAMKGNGSASFPQEARIRVGRREIVARIGGELGALVLTVETTAGQTPDGPRRTAAIPVLPVPGSLRLAPDGRSAAWLEIASPSKIVPVIASLAKDEPAREIAFLSSGRPLRDRSLAHVVTALTGYSSDGRRLGLSIEAWNETPGPRPRRSIVSVATGELLFETSSNRKRFQRLLE